MKNIVIYSGNDVLEETEHFLDDGFIEELPTLEERLETVEEVLLEMTGVRL